MDIHEVLHRPTPPPNLQNRWHIVLQGHPLELLEALERIIEHDGHVLQTAEWTHDDVLVICLMWIDDVIPKFVEHDIRQLSNDIKIKVNGRAACQGHNIPA